MNRQYYELRIYKIYDYEKQVVAEGYLETALMPALTRLGIDPVGVFTNLDDENDHSLYVLIPFDSAESFGTLNSKLDKDEAYQTGSAIYFDRPLKDPVFERIESRFMVAFSGMPKLELPELSKKKQERIFELRLYESHTEDHARRKVKMFDEGEIQIMRDVNLGPVFYGSTLIGPDVPNLVYMLSCTDKETHKKHFKDFLKHPEWDRIKVLPEYKGTVSKIRNWFLKPTRYSQI